MPVGANIDLGGYQRIDGLSVSSLDGYLVPPMDVSNYKWISLYITPDFYDGTVAFQGSLDGVHWKEIELLNLSTLNGTDVVSRMQYTNDIMVGGPVRFNFFAVQMIFYNSDTANGTLFLMNEAPAFPLASVYASLLGGNSQIGLTYNDGILNQDVAAGVATDTVIYSSPCHMANILVTDAGGGAQVNIYDNGSAASGKIIAIIPAGASAGDIIASKGGCGSGITVKGNAANPGFTMWYSPHA